MPVTKLRQTQESGLVPAGAYFKRLAAGLEKTGAAEATRRKDLDAEDRAVEARYRRASALRANTYAPAAAYH